VCCSNNFFSKRKVSPESPFKERRGGSGFTIKKEKNKKGLYIPDLPDGRQAVRLSDGELVFYRSSYCPINCFERDHLFR
jgi:hypothetical protein